MLITIRCTLRKQDKQSSTLYRPQHNSSSSNSNSATTPTAMAVTWAWTITVVGYMVAAIQVECAERAAILYSVRSYIPTCNF